METRDFILKKYERIFVIVLDSLGIGAMPDSEKFGDVGVDTFWIKWAPWKYQILRSLEC